MTRTTFGDKIRALRLKLGITDRELAQRASLSERTVYHLEHGTSPTLNTAKALATALNVSLDYLTEPDGLSAGTEPHTPTFSQSTATEGSPVQ